MVLRPGLPGPKDTPLAIGVYWSEGAYGRLDFDVAQALAFAYQRASQMLGHEAPPIIITQGAHYQPTPGRAHDGGGVADLRTRHMTEAEKDTLIRALVAENFGVYDLGPPDSGPHLHIILRHSPNLNAAARDQIARARHA